MPEKLLHLSEKKYIRCSELSDGNISGWVDAADTGVLSADVANFRGSELPSTGGMGTTLFYIAGGTAVVAACFVLVMKKKENMA